MKCRFVTCPHSDYARYCYPTCKLPRILNLLAIWIHVYTCFSGCKYAYISCYSVFVMRPFINYGMGHKSGRRSNIFGSHLVDQQFFTSLGGGNPFHTSCLCTCASWYIFKWMHVPIGGSNISRLIQGDKKYLGSNIHASCWATCLPLPPPHN